MEFMELLRRWKRILDNYFTYRRTFILILVVFGIILYLGPSLFRFLSKSPIRLENAAERCLSDRLASFYVDAEEFNVNIRHYPLAEGEKSYIPYVGNGIFGLSIEPDSPLYIRNGRTLSLPVYWHPILSLERDLGTVNEATVVNYVTGVTYKFQCFASGVSITYQYMAHRTIPAVLVQEIKITNPSNENLDINLEQFQHDNWPSAASHVLNLPTVLGKQEYQVTTGIVQVPVESNVDVIAVSIVSKKLPRSLSVKARNSRTLEILTTLNYSEPINKADSDERKDLAEKQAIECMKKALTKTGDFLKEAHTNVWQHLWQTGLSISYSKADGSINGDNINATIYYVLSQVTAPYYEEATTADRKQQLATSLAYADGCYGGFHTLQATNLWRDHSTLDVVNSMTSHWLLTLEKQGCHNLLKAGASGVIQAMTLSLGALRFSNQHLELRIHPKDLHRDYLFRRISYGNATHVNISIVLQTDNKAMLLAALDRSDKYYYACDGGCLDSPVQLGPQKKEFPVKLTDPVTAILYITADRQHMEDLRHAIHVKEVVDAPPLETNVIALHRHGSHLGGLPTLFWIAISILIVIFHLFLFKLIYNEYCSPSPDKYRTRYGKL